MNNLKLNESFGTLSETINGLIQLGYSHDFNIQGDCLVCHQINQVLSPDDFQIDKVYRFEGDADPDYQSILYAISSERFGIKGTLVNGYGISSEEIPSELIKKLRTHKNIDLNSNRVEENISINNSMQEMNLLQLIERLKSEKSWMVGDRNAITIFKSPTMRIVLMGLHENAILKPHKAKGVISVQVLEGQMSFATDHQNTILEKGQMIALQENYTHEIRAIKECFFLLTLALNPDIVLND